MEIEDSKPVNGNGGDEGQYAYLRTLSTSVLVERLRFANMAGMTFNGLRDEYLVLGYDRVISNKMYRDEYDRGGIAHRIVDSLPNATWRGNVEVIEDDDPEVDTAFEKAWVSLEKKHKLQAKLLRTDKLSRLSTYAVLLIGAGGDLNVELPRAVNGAGRLLYFQPFSGGGGPGIDARTSTSAFEADCTIKDYEDDPKNERFGLPRTYQLKRRGVSAEGLREVHWSRIVHVAEGLLDDDVFGQPALECVWNLLIDLRKVTGGGAEAFWLRANQGMQLNLDKDMTLPPADPVTGKSELDKLRQDAEEYQHQIRRVLRTRGVDITMLGSDVANFSNPADAVLTQIAGATGIPKRILTGSEMGELASSQDRDNWKDQVVGRQMGYAGPYIVKQLVDRLVAYGYLPAPKKGVDEYQVRWPLIETLTETEKASGAQQWASTNSTAGEVVFTVEEIRDKWYGMEPLTDEQRAEIADKAAEKLKQQQELMKAKQPPRPADDGNDGEFPRAAGDAELVRLLAEAIETQDDELVLQLVGLGGPDSGNFGHEGRPGQVGGSGEGDDEPHVDVVSRDGNPKNPAEIPHGSVVARSKYGNVELVRTHGGRTEYLARKKNGQSVGTYKNMDSAKDGLRTNFDSQMVRSGYLRPQVAWKHPYGLEKDA